MNAEPAPGRRTLALGLALGLATLAFAFPLPGLSEEGRRLSAVLAAVGVLWVTEALPLAATALLGPTFAVALGVAAAKSAFAALSNPILLLFIGSFLIARALEKHRMSERIAYRALSLGLVRSDPLRAFVLLGLSTAFLSAFVSNTATTAMMLPIAQSVLGAMHGPAGGAAKGAGPPPRFASALMLLVAYSASLGGLFTPVGTPPNLIGLAQIEQATGVRISFGEWIAQVFPVTFATLLAMMAWMAFRFRGELGALVHARARLRARHRALGRWTRAQAWSTAALALAFAGWVAPTVAGFVDPGARELLEARLPEGIVPLLACAPLFLVRVPSASGAATVLGQRDLREIDWATILLFGGGMCLGDLMGQTGVARAVGELVAGAVPSGGLLVVLCAAFAIVVSELTSNTAAANMVVPVTVAVAHQAGTDPVTPALAATVACTFGFMLPVSTPTNAMAYATGHVSQREMIRSGIVLDLLGAALLGLWFGGPAGPDPTGSDRRGPTRGRRCPSPRAAARSPRPSGAGRSCGR
jgi:sodium-dependent dicarboxylate transporter 2/3/5